MNTIYSPNNIEVLIHYHCSILPHPRIEAEAVKEATERFFQEGVIERSEQDGPNCYTTTAKGRAWMQALCNVAPPKQVWVDEHDNILER